MNALDRLMMEDRIREILAAMTPGQLVAAALRADGLRDEEIGELLGVSGSAIGHRMEVAQRRIMDAVPEARIVLMGRSRVRLSHDPEEWRI